MVLLMRGDYVRVGRVKLWKRRAASSWRFQRVTFVMAARRMISSHFSDEACANRQRDERQRDEDNLRLNLASTSGDKKRETKEMEDRRGPAYASVQTRKEKSHFRLIWR